MAGIEIHPYHYGIEAEQYTFYRLPKVLFTNDRYNQLSDGAKILYGLMLDRMSLSMKNGWLDKENRVYIYFTVNDVEKHMNGKRDKAMKLLAELDNEKGAGLIERVKQGLGKPSVIYVKKFIDSAGSEKPTVIILISISLKRIRTIGTIHLSILLSHRKQVRLPIR